MNEQAEFTPSINQLENEGNNIRKAEAAFMLGAIAMGEDVDQSRVDAMTANMNSEFTVAPAAELAPESIAVEQIDSPAESVEVKQGNDLVAELEAADNEASTGDRSHATYELAVDARKRAELLSAEDQGLRHDLDQSRIDAMKAEIEARYAVK